MPRILVAGCDHLLSPECRLLLESAGYRLKGCASLRQAMAQVLEDPPDLLLAERGFAGKTGDRDLIRAVKSCLHKANIPVLLVVAAEEVAAELDWNAYPVDDILLPPFSPQILLVRIRLAEARLARSFDTNPLSRLPGNTSILRAIQRTLDSDRGFGIGYVDIDSFKPYNDRYGFARGDEVILMVARILVNVVEEMARAESFVGHVGGDDFVFIVAEEKIRPVCERVLRNFDLVRNMFLSAGDIATGSFIGMDRLNRETSFGLLSLSIAVLTTGGRKYRHYGEVSAAASQVKQYVKQLEGSNFLIDRRDS